MITEKERLPLYNRVREHLRAEYLNGSHDALPSLRELSQKLEINHATISRALRDLEREGVVEIIPRKGIFPIHKSPAAVLNGDSPAVFTTQTRSVASGSFEMVVLYDQLHGQLEVARPIFEGMLQASDTARAKGQPGSVVQTTVPVSAVPDSCRFLQQVRVRETAGVVFLGYGYLPFPESLVESRFIFDISRHVPVLLAGTPHPQLPLDCVYCDPRPQMREFLDCCYAQGLRRFEFIGSGSTLPHQVERHEEFCNFVMRNGLTWAQEYLRDSSVEQITARLRELPELPEVVVATNTSRAVAVALEAQRRGLSLPDDLKLLCFASLTRDAEPLLPYASVLLMDEGGVGRRAWQLLKDRVGDGAMGSEEVNGEPAIERVPAKFISRF